MLNSRRLRHFRTRYVAPGPLERDPGFRDALRRLSWSGLRVAGVVAVIAAAGYLVVNLVLGYQMVWTRGDSDLRTVTLWSRLLLVAGGLFLIGLSRVRVGLGVARLAMALFLVGAAWLLVFRYSIQHDFTLSAAAMTLMMTVALGTVPFQPWQAGALGLALTAEFWYYASLTAETQGDLTRLLFLLLMSFVVTVVAATLYDSRYEEYRALRRAAWLKDQLAARERVLEEQREALAEERTRLEAALVRERAAQDRMVQQEKLASLGQLTAGIAHEIKNPLNFVNNFASLSVDLVLEVCEALERDPDRPASAVAAEVGEVLDDLTTNVTKIAEHGRRADGIVRNMLAHSRATPGERRPADVNRLLDEYVGLAYHGKRAAHATFNVDIRREYDPALLPLPVVPEEMGRVFLNLLDNAFDAVRARAAAEAADSYVPVVHVSTRQRAGGGAEVRVRDNGSGIPDEVRDRIFEPFFTTKPTGEGTGLGLSLSYDIVTKGHGGTLTLASAPGGGTTFILALPPVVLSAPPAADVRAAVGLAA